METIEINVDEYMPIITAMPFMKEIINLLSNDIFTFNLKFDTKLQHFKQNKKSNEFINNIDLTKRPHFYEESKYEINNIVAISKISYDSNKIYNNNNKNIPIKNNYLNYFYKIIKNVNCSNINNTDKGLYNKFKKLSIYYRILFIRMYEHKEEIENINNRQTELLRLDNHGDSHCDLNNAFNSKKNNSFYIKNLNDNRHINEILFQQFYENYNIIFEIVYYIYRFLLDCRENKIIPLFINTDEYNDYNIKNIFDTSDNKIILHLINYDQRSSFFNQTKQLYHPKRIQLFFNNHEQKYRLQYDEKNLNESSVIQKDKIIMIQKNNIDNKNLKRKQNN
jgi:hypothetical protein